LEGTGVAESAEGCGEQAKFPSRATKSISLMLIGSSLLLAGCGGSQSTCQEDPNLPKDKQKNCSGSRSYYHGYGGSRTYVRSSGGGTSVGRTSVGTTTRGGFGGTGHAVAGG
jgi:hypothetical protein